MRQRKVWRYYCDHCRKGGCAKAAMARHERGCVRNPDRECGLCAKAGMQQASLGVLRESLVDGGVDALGERAGGCPACMLAAIVQERRSEGYDGGDAAWSSFDYRQAHAAFWSAVDEARGKP